ncbi:MAG TPA: TonB-dependent siderophore receptor [Pseudolabrys sp.]|nr:TonB-dependent siderophore receptor [Pseudolabrys sp.]
MREGGRSRHIPMLLATTFLVVGCDAGTMRVAAQEKPQPEAAGGDANAQAITLDTISVQGDSGRTEGYFAPSTSVATKTNTPLLNIPQSLTVVTRDFIKDQGSPSLTDITRYVPGVAVHQGEGNRDELVIRGVDSSANFFVNGFRDDVQYFRDLYNAQSVEILRGPSALTFGRGAGGGLLNRTLKEADGTRVYDVTAQTGSFWDRRVTVDAGQAVNDTFAARLNMMYEAGDTFRDFGKFERWGINPTVTYKPDNATKIRLSYEYYHDERTADRGNPSQGLNAVAPSSTRFNPAAPFAPNGALAAFFGSPNLNIAHADVQQTMAFIDHDFGNGLTAKNSTMFADYKKFYQNVYPGSGPLSGAVNPSDTAFNRAAYNHTTNRDNLINQTDFFYKTSTGPLLHSIAFGTEFGRQSGIDVRNTGIFPNGTNTIVGNPFDPTYFGPVNFVHQYPGAFSPGVTTPDSNSNYLLYTASAYVRDTIDITRWLQLIGGVRFDRFDESALDMNTNTNRSLINNNVSPQAAVIVKPADNVSVYGAYSVSYLPASGDQFSALNNGNIILAPQKFVNKEVGVKWNIQPRLQFAAAVYDLERTNIPLPDPNNPGFFILSGSNRVRGFETSLNGYITNEWQSTLGYAYTDARVTSATSATIVPGNRIQLVPLNQFSWWNKCQFTPVWGAALGVIYFSDSFASSDDTVLLPGWVRFDAALYLKINETWRAQLNVENIFDKGYWASADGNNNLSPGATRTIRLSATAKF